jgi:tagatose-6-phosphate ketose/aldose isomerase
MSDPTTSATYAEITSQPRIWRELAGILRSGAAANAAFLEPLLARPDLRIVLTGAGTSAFVGEIAAPALSRATGRRVEQVPTTDIVSNPRESFAQDVPSLLVSFARSGDSPESVAAADLADQILGEPFHLVLTCAAEGALAATRTGRAGSHVVLMPPDSNDTGFAMTSSFTSMLLSCLVLLGEESPDLLERLADSADELLATRVDGVAELAARDAGRLVCLGSGPLRGVAHEAGLKFLELTAGARVSFFESALGFRHGPKAVVDDDTQVIVFVSSDPYTRLYDLDIVAELRAGIGADKVLVLAASPVDVDGAWVLPGLDGVPDAFAAAVHIIVPQLLGVYTSAALGKHVDNPFPSGDVNRVVQGVVIHAL